MIAVMQSQCTSMGKMEVAKPADAESALTSLRQPAGKKHEEANETIETLEAAAKVRLQHMQRP